ncbi:MAG: M13 family metallopeptidase [Sphingomonas sp.]|uniref:M13 family metallopeptidase n=1 Tax=Sphingomonas sp. TaxID=28214 RepID=UPI001808CBE0|nr:M13 family metallopeptidase [Sphingomonas sp.]MBA3666396.1 M13 family metallopeptidase [Sphingomonas sp.]
MALAHLVVARDAPAPHSVNLPTLEAAGDGINRQAVDMSVAACDDFYQHACGGFLATAKPTDAHPVVSLADDQFNADLERSLRQIFARPTSGNHELARLRTFYESCRNGDSSDAVTVRRWLAKIDAAHSPREIQSLMRELSVIGVNPFINYGGQPDRKNWKRYRGEIHNGNLWAEPTTVNRSFVLAGLSAEDARRDTKAVVDINKALQAHRGDRYNAATGENVRSLAQLEQIAPAIEWRSYFALVGAPTKSRVNVTSPAYLEDVQQQLIQRSPVELRAYLRWVFLFSLRGELPAPYNQEFGAVSPNVRVALDDVQRRCREATIRAMGVEFSRQYAHHILGWKSRDVARRIAESIKHQIVETIANDQWLSRSARQATADKLRHTDLKIGFPDRWPAVGSYPISTVRFFDNVLSARRFEQRREWGRALQVRDRKDWEMKIQPWVGEGMAAARLVLPNGFPEALSNSLIMTAAFLSPPRFDVNAPPELNYATFGATFAHEFVHVAEAHMFGPDGNDTELWRPSDLKAADEQGQCVIRQADAYQPLPGVKMSGQYQFGENVADYGGLRLAYGALAVKLRTSLNHRDATGTTPAQRFFYRFAQRQCTAQTERSLRQTVAADRHAPPSFRVNGPLSNLPAFAQAFNCKPGAHMVRPKTGVCRVW